VVVLPLDEILAGQRLDGLIQGATWLILGVPLWTVAFVYVTLQLGLNRLGRCWRPVWGCSSCPCDG
jgi:hypothetical protein